MKKAFCRNRDEIQEKLRIPIVMQSILNVTLYRHMLYPESISGNFSYKTQLVKKKKMLTEGSCSGLSGTCILLQQVGNQQYFTLNGIKPTYIHHFQVPNIEIVAMEKLHLNVYFTKQYKLTTENALPVYKQTIQALGIFPVNDCFKTYQYGNCLKEPCEMHRTWYNKGSSCETIWRN